MPIEIERKYLLWEEGIDSSTPALLQVYSSISALRTKVLAKGVPIRQGYLPLSVGFAISKILGMGINFEPGEARLRDRGGVFYFALKENGSDKRGELEQIVTPELFGSYWDLTKGKRIFKMRDVKPYAGHSLETDVYTDRDLITAEIEIPQGITIKNIIGVGLDITDDIKYKNKNLAK